MSVLRHPNIVMFLGACSQPPCMVTEYCARGSLLDILTRARECPVCPQPCPCQTHGALAPGIHLCGTHPWVGWLVSGLSDNLPDEASSLASKLKHRGGQA